MIKFFKFLLFAASVICGAYCVGSTYITPVERTVSFALACLFFLLFLGASFLKKLWTKSWAAAAVLLLVLLTTIPLSTFRSLTLTEIFGVDELSPVEYISVEPLAVDYDAATPIWAAVWIPDDSPEITAKMAEDSDDVILVSGGSMDPSEGYLKDMTIRNYWLGEPQEAFNFYSITIRFTDSRRITLYSYNEVWRVVWDSKWTDSDWLNGYWYTATPITELFDSQVLEYINALFR